MDSILDSGLIADHRTDEAKMENEPIYDVYNHSVYKWCWSCQTPGVPTPENETCGNCNRVGYMVEIPGL